MVRGGNHEGVCDDHRHGFWVALIGTHLACHRGWAASGDGPLVHSLYGSLGGSLRLGCAFASEAEELEPAFLRRAMRAASVRFEVPSLLIAPDK